MADWAEAVAGRLPSTSCGKWLTTLLQSDRFNWNRLILRTNCIKLSNASFRIGYQVGTGNKLLQFVNHLATNSQRVGTAWHNKLFQLVWLRLAAVWFAESGSILSTTCYSLCVTGCDTWAKLTRRACEVFWNCGPFDALSGSLQKFCKLHTNQGL